MTEYSVVVALEAHAMALAPRVRKADAREVWASHHYTPENALLTGLHMSQEAKAGMADDEVVCIFGVVQPTLLSTYGMPWMLASDALVYHSRAFLRRNRAYVQQISDKHALLLNFVDARNTIAIRWLEWLGFDLEEAQPYGLDQLPFHRFTMESINV